MECAAYQAHRKIVVETAARPAMRPKRSEGWIKDLQKDVTSAKLCRSMSN